MEIGVSAVSNTENNEFSTLKKLEDLTFEQALYQFPCTMMAILDEDGAIVAANPQWINAFSEQGLIPYNGCELGANFFELCRISLPLEVSSELINRMKQVVVGVKKAFVHNIPDTETGSDSGALKKIFVCPVSDSPNSIVVAYGPDRVPDADLHQAYQDEPGIREESERHFA